MISKSNTPLNNSRAEFEPTEMNQYYSVEFTIDEIVPLYQFRLRNNENMALFVIVKEDSEILNRLEVGRILKMKYYNTDVSCPPEVLQTQIINIRNDKEGRFSGHCMVGLSILSPHKNNQLN